MGRCQAEGYAWMPHVIQKTRNLAGLVEPRPDLIREGKGNASILGCPAECPNVIGGLTSFIFATRGAPIAAARSSRLTRSLPNVAWAEMDEGRRLLSSSLAFSSPAESRAGSTCINVSGVDQRSTYDSLVFAIAASASSSDSDLKSSVEHANLVEISKTNILGSGREVVQ